MIFSLGGGKRLVVTSVSALTLTFSLAACSGSDGPSPLDEPATSATASATPDQAAVDQAAVSDLVTRYWAAQVAAQNAGDDSGQQFATVARGGFIEGTLKSIRDATADGVSREGEPAVSEVEITVAGDTADIRACVNENEWIFVQDGKDLGFTTDGNRPWGAEATRSGDAWMITDVRLPPQGDKVCS